MTLERVFWVLLKRFGIISHPCRFADIKGIKQVPHSCCILDNVIAQIWEHKGTMNFWRDMEQSVESKRVMKKLSERLTQMIVAKHKRNFGGRY